MGRSRLTSATALLSGRAALVVALPVISIAFSIAIAIAFVSTLLVPARAHALEPIPGEERFQQMFEKPDETEIAASVGFGMIAEDFYVSVVPRFDLNLGLFGFGLQVPLNLRVIDNAPTSNDMIGGVLRKQDWDEPGEFLRVIRYVRWGYKRDFIYARAGELSAGELGHGTIVSRYVNNTDVDTYRLGLQFDLNTNYGGVETILADIGMFANDYVDSRMFGARAYIKPVGLWDPESFLNIFQVGMTTVVDANAPYILETEQFNAPGPGGPESRLVIDERSNFGVARTRETIALGWDVEAELMNNIFIDLIPYIDLNYIVDGDPGLHMGVQARFKLPFLLELTIPMKIEYRHFGAHYFPTYFGGFYELERFNYGPGATPGNDPDPTVTGEVGEVPGDGRPKSFVLRNGAGVGGRNGYFGDAGFDIAGYVQVGALYEDYEGSTGGNLAIYVNVPAVDWLQLKGYYARTSIKDTGDIFAIDERSLIVAQARWEIISYLYLVARWTVRWEIDTTTRRPKEAHDWKVGIEAGYTF